MEEILAIYRKHGWQRLPVVGDYIEYNRHYYPPEPDTTRTVLSVTERNITYMKCRPAWQTGEAFTEAHTTIAKCFQIAKPKKLRASMLKYRSRL